jgi:hypothetical protein
MLLLVERDEGKRGAGVFRGRADGCFTYVTSSESVFRDRELVRGPFG